MRQLTGMDAQFLNLETARSVGHVTNVYILDPGESAVPVNGDTVRAYLAERMHLVEPLTWRLIQVPMGLDRPYWVEDPDVDLRYHVRSLALPKPGSDEQLAEVVARLATRPLDRDRPLWELYVIEGLAGGLVALVLKLHHAAFNGRASVRFLTSLFVADPTTSPPPAPPAKVIPPIPDASQMWVRGWTDVMTKPDQGLGYIVSLAQGGRRLAGRLGLDLADWTRVLRGTGRAPRLSFNTTLSQHRTWAFGSVALDEVKAVKNAAGVTLNDVVMAMCAGALRRWLVDHGELPDGPLLAMVPVATRTADQAGPSGQRVSSMIAALPTQFDTAGERLAAAHEAMQATRDQQAVPAELLMELREFTAPAAAQLVADTMARERWVDRVAPPFNLVIANVPGPREPLYFAGARLVAAYPLSLISDGVGLNITIASIQGRLFYGIVGTPELVPEIWSLAQYLSDELGLLAKATEAPSA